MKCVVCKNKPGEISVEVIDNNIIKHCLVCAGCENSKWVLAHLYFPPKRAFIIEKEEHEEVSEEE